MDVHIVSMQEQCKSLTLMLWAIQAFPLLPFTPPRTYPSGVRVLYVSVLNNNECVRAKGAKFGSHSSEPFKLLGIVKFHCC